MTEQEVKRMTPIQRLAYFVRERESVRLKKEAGEPKPWTDDKILQQYRFCCVRRMDDKVSKWLLDTWYTPYFNHPNMVVAVALARFFNLPSTLNVITPLVFGKNYQPDKIKERLRGIKTCGETIFNSAYMVRGNDSQDKIGCVVDYYVQPLVDKPPLIHRDSMEFTWSELLSYYGMGSFMAGQIVADLRHAMKGSWKDCNSWAPPGPGSQRGMARVLGLPIKTKFKPEVFVKNLIDIRSQLTKVQPTGYELVPKHIMSRLEAIDQQSCLCELDKFDRVLFGEGRPKQRYDGVGARNA